MRISVYLPDDLGGRAKAAGVEFSRVLRQAVKEQLDREGSNAGGREYMFQVPEGEAAVHVTWGHSRVCIGGWVHRHDGSSVPLIPAASARNRNHRATWTTFVLANRNAQTARLDATAPW